MPAYHSKGYPRRAASREADAICLNSATPLTETVRNLLGYTLSERFSTFLKTPPRKGDLETMMMTKTEKLQKAACGPKIWKEIGNMNCSFRSALEWFAGAMNQEHELRQKARRLLAEIDEDVAGYGKKYPRTPWDKCEVEWLTETQAAESIAEEYAPGYTHEPYVQLIRIGVDGSKSVVAEWSQGQWIGPLTAAGFEDRSI